MERIIVNATGKVRRAKGPYKLDYLVAPLSMIAPGVLPGSNGPLLYPPEEVGRDPTVWNHVPIVVQHPSVDDQPISARSPEVITNRGIGFVFNSRYNGKLVAEGWFEETSTRRVDERIFLALESGRPIELSTGLHVDTEAAPPNAVHNAGGKLIPYIGIARNYRPDHLAILPDEVGACSLKDGCGVLVNQSKDQGEVKTLLSRLGSLLGIKSKESPTANELSHEQLRDQLHQALRSRFTQDEPGAWINEVYDGFFVYEQAGKQYTLKYTKSDGGVTISDEAPVEVIREVTFKPISNSQEPTMADKLNDVDRKKLVDNLVTNECCWKESDRETLNKMSDETLKALTDQLSKQKPTLNQTAVDAAAKEGFNTLYTDSQSKAPVTNQSVTPGLTADQKADLEFVRILRNERRSDAIAKITANAANKLTREQLEKLPPDVLQSLVDTLGTAPVANQDTATTTTPVVNYSGAAAPAPVANTGAKIEPLDLPRMDWSELATS